jgi:hypothetical protein
LRPIIRSAAKSTKKPQGAQPVSGQEERPLGDLAKKAFGRRRLDKRNPGFNKTKQAGDESESVMKNT